MLHVHPAEIDGVYPHQDVSVLVYYDAPPGSNMIITITSDDPVVAQPSDSVVVISAGGQATTFTLSFGSAGSAVITVSDGTETRQIPVSLARQNVEIAVDPPAPIWAALLPDGKGQVTAVIEDVDNLISTYGFDRIHWQVSLDGGATFRDLTTDTAQPAEVMTTTSPPWDLQGHTLFLTDQSGYEHDLVFEGNNPWDVIRTAEWIDVHGGFETGHTGDTIFIRTPDSGQVQQLRVTGGGAVSILGLDGDVHYGTDAHQLLTSGIINYVFYDLTNPAIGAIYRYRLLTADGDYSRWSPSISMSGPYVTDESHLCRCHLYLADLGVMPFQNRTVVFDFPEQYFSLSGSDYKVVGFRLEAETDRSGHAEVVLPRGITVEYWISGTSVRRRVTIPDEQSCDLSDPSISSDPDRWSIALDDTPAGVIS